MADNFYIYEDILALGLPTFNDDGTGTDWLVLSGNYGGTLNAPGAFLILSNFKYNVNPDPTDFAFAFTLPLTWSAVRIFGGIENAMGGAGSENIFGSDVANVLQGDPDNVAGSADLIQGYLGEDTLYGMGGSDALYGGNDNDLIFGDDDPFGPGTNVAPGNDTVYGGLGNDTVHGGRGNNSLNGEVGYDTVSYAGFFDDFGSTTYRIVAYLQSGTVVVYARDEFGAEIVAATDTVTGFEVIYGTAGNDLIQGNYNFAPGDYLGNVLHGGAGNDVLTGTNGVDALFGGDGTDNLDDYDNNIPGNTGADLLNGGLGDDYYFVRNATTVILETEPGGYDRVATLVGYALPDWIEALLITSFAGAANGTGNALANQLDGNDAANDLGGLAGDDYLFGYGATDTLRGGSGQDSLYGGTEEDALTGGSQNDLLYGEAGSDTLSGGSEADQLYGGSQGDLLQGGLGRDILRGGSGADTFYFASAAEAAMGRGAVDVIQDFHARQDQIDLHRIVKGQTYIGSAAFGGTGDAEVRYDRVKGILTGDIDGDGRADYQINLGAGTALAAGDLIL